MSKPRIVCVESEALAPYAPGLRALEAGIAYPIGGGADSFRIDHGETYHPFFSSLGRAWFLVALAGEEVVGTLALVAREASLG
ncbi:GNAT family N-acetyltransferase, partial [bacterium]|nr:GNAT family N-acetyltransferase [bacterium]